MRCWRCRPTYNWRPTQAPLEAELYRLRGEALLAGAGTVSEASPLSRYSSASSGARQLRIGLQRQQHMLADPKTVTVQP